ncbi:MAG: HD domain-containing protein [Candidatus Magasanikbacteria bacterium]
MLFNKSIKSLIIEAQQQMSHSFDPLHDLRHVERVVKNVKKISAPIKLTQIERDALELAAWWHDISRAINNKPSMIWMAMFDDNLSALALLFYTIKYRIKNKVALKTFGLLMCNGMITGKIMTKIFANKKTRLLLNLLKDADMMDLMNINRFYEATQLAQMSKKNLRKFRMLIWYNLNSNILEMKTFEARIYIEEIIINFLEWISNKENYLWHEENFGKDWIDKTINKLQETLGEITKLNNLQQKST